MNTFHGLAMVILLFFTAPSSRCAEDKVRDIVPPFPEFADAHPRQVRDGGIVLPFIVKQGDARVFWDFPLHQGALQDATSLVLDSSLSVEGIVSGVTVQLRCGSTWYTAQIAIPNAQRGRVAVPLSRFNDGAGTVCDSRDADTLRISIWQPPSQGSGSFFLYRLQARRDVIALVDTGDDAARARCRALFDRAGIPYAEIGDDFTQARNFNLVVIPTTPLAFEKNALRELKKAVREGVQLIVFYTASQEVASLLEVFPGVWKGGDAKSAWISMVPESQQLAGFSERIPHETTNVIPPYEGKDAVAVAFWSDSNGHQTKLPACVWSTKGVWFSHLPPLPTRPATEFLRRICLRYEPNLAERFAVKALMDNEPLLERVPQGAEALVRTIRDTVQNRESLEAIPQRCSELRDFVAADYLRSVACPTGEVRAVWDARAPYRSEATWGKVLDNLRTLGINTLFAQAGNGVSSDSGFDGASGFSLKQLSAKAQESSVSVHAWLYTLSVEGFTKRELAGLAACNRLVVSQDGSPKNWLCPRNSENRAQIINRVLMLAESGAEGIHLDYMRFPDETGCFCKTCRSTFERRSLGKKVKNWPADVIGTGVYSEAYRAFQIQSVTELVSGIAEVLRKPGVRVALSAAVFPEASSAAMLGQDWPAWVASGQVDFVCPMTYQTDEAVFASQISRAVIACAGRRDRILPGIGTTADVPGPDAYGAAQQILELRKRKCRGFAFFSLDELLLNSILPFLELMDDDAKQSRRISDGE